MDFLHYEKKIWKLGKNNIAGLDEVGRGCLAGPVVTGAVCFDKNLEKLNIPSNIEINDSKKLSDKKRRTAAQWIKKNAKGWGVGIGTISEINRKGIVSATYSGFRRSLVNMQKMHCVRIDFLLIDAFYIPYVRGIRMPSKTRRNSRKTINIAKISSQQLAIINGDEKSFLIAAASIVAKVTRDDLMIKLSKNEYYRRFGWQTNKGYGTKNHLLAIRKYGTTKYHRKIFVHL